MASSALTAALARVRGQQQPEPAAGKGKAEVLPQALKTASDEGVAVLEMTAEEAGALADQAFADGVAAERARIAGILGHAEAEGRRGLAEHLAFAGGQTVEDAAALLAKSAKEAAPAPQAVNHPLASLMKQASLPEPPDGGDGAPGGDAAQTNAARILGARAKWRGKTSQ